MRTVLDVRVLRGTGGGPEKTLCRSVGYLKRYGYQVVCAYLCDPADLEANQRIQEARRYGVDIVTIPDYGPWDIAIIRRMRHLVTDICPAIYHAHDYKSTIFGTIIRPQARIYRVVTLHGWVHTTAKLSLYYLIEKQCLRLYNRVYCVSPDLSCHARRLGVPQKQVCYLPNGIEVDKYRRTKCPAEARRSLGLNPQGIWLGSVGRLEPEKNFQTLLQVAGQLCMDRYPIHVLLVGNGSQADFLKKQTATLGIQDRVYFAGFCTDVRPWLECMDIYICPSWREGMPNSVLEAMAMEVPVIASRVGGLPYLIRDRQDGILVAPGDVRGICNAVKELYTGRTNASEITMSARCRVEQEFNFEKRMERLAEDYDQLLKGVT